MITILFWSFIGLIIYTYVLFPVLVWLRGCLWPRPWQESDHRPSASIIVAAYNEAASIGRKLDNLSTLDYPRELVEILVACDGCTDETEAIARSRANSQVRVLSLPRSGKAAALNKAVEAASGEILVFSDANSMFTPGALRALVRPFADSAVGGVAGDQCYERRSNGQGAGEHSYWNFDRWMKRWESRAGNVISATGAIYAIRRRLFQPVPQGVTDDFVISTRVIAQGFRLIFTDTAIACEPAASSPQLEFRRKVRIITRGLRGVLVMRELLNPLRFGFYALQLFSHKVLRRLIVFALLGLLPSSAWLWNNGMTYQATLAVQLAIYGCAAVGLLLAKTRFANMRIFALPAFFCLVNMSSLVASFKLLMGECIVSWEPCRAREMEVPHTAANIVRGGSGAIVSE